MFLVHRGAGGRAAPALLLAVACLAACENDPGHFEMVFDPCAPLVLEPEQGMAADTIASIEDAVAMWQEVARVQLTLEPTPDARALPVLGTDTELYYGRFDDQQGVIWLADALDDRRVRAVVLAHELGHAFSLYHVDPEERASVMNEGNTDLPPTASDGAALSRVWGDCVLPASP
ncbi:MAG TPA: hypothetical protein VKZ63_20725 [Kofleriaceae bacterium]|nr:hypothetical protein [Kofleriaceae bacterium]